MIVKSSRIFIEALMSIVLSLLGPSDEGAGDAEFPLHAPGQVPAPLVALVRDPEVGDHPAALICIRNFLPAIKVKYTMGRPHIKEPPKRWENRVS